MGNARWGGNEGCLCGREVDVAREPLERVAATVLRLKCAPVGDRVTKEAEEVARKVKGRRTRRGAHVCGLDRENAHLGFGRNVKYRASKSELSRLGTLLF